MTPCWPVTFSVDSFVAMLATITAIPSLKIHQFSLFTASSQLQAARRWHGGGSPSFGVAGGARGRGGANEGCTPAVGAIRIRVAIGTERSRAAMSSPAPLPIEINQSAQRGELQKVVKWLRKAGPVDALCSDLIRGGQPSTFGLLHIAATHGQLEIMRMLLKRGATVDLQGSLGLTALMDAAYYGHLPIVLVLLQQSANPDLQSNNGYTALMKAANEGHEACVQALLRAKASTELLDKAGDTALQWAEDQGHTAIAKLIRQHAAPPQPAAAVAPQATQAEQAAQAARADAAMEELLAEEAAEQAKAQAPSKKSKKKKKAGHAIAADDEPSEAPPATAPAPPPATAPKPVASAAERAEAALRAAIAGGGLSALEAALAAAPRGVREGRVGTEAWAMCDRLLKAQQEAEREAKQGAAAEAARLAAAVRAVAASKAREEAVKAAEAAAAAAAKADTLERAMADGGEGSSSGAAGPSMASEAVEVPDDYICPITAEIMTDPVSTSDGFTYEREAITEWLRTKDTSPVTGTTLESKTLIPNLSLRSMIRSFA